MTMRNKRPVFLITYRLNSVHLPSHYTVRACGNVSREDFLCRTPSSCRCVKHKGTRDKSTMDSCQMLLWKRSGQKGTLHRIPSLFVCWFCLCVKKHTNKQNPANVDVSDTSWSLKSLMGRNVTFSISNSVGHVGDAFRRRRILSDYFLLTCCHV